MSQVSLDAVLCPHPLELTLLSADKAAPKGRKTMVKLPWELLTPFSDFLKTVPSKQGKMGPAVNDDEDDEDEDELQAHQDSMQRLKASDTVPLPRHSLTLLAGCRRDHEENDQRRVCPLLGLSAGQLHLQEM